MYKYFFLTDEKKRRENFAAVQNYNHSPFQFPRQAPQFLISTPQEHISQVIFCVVQKPDLGSKRLEAGQLPLAGVVVHDVLLNELKGGGGKTVQESLVGLRGSTHCARENSFGARKLNLLNQIPLEKWEGVGWGLSHLWISATLSQKHFARATNSIPPSRL